MGQNTGETPLGLWRKKLEFLQKEEATANSSAQKFKLKQDIAEARKKIAELEGEEAQLSELMEAQTRIAELEAEIARSPKRQHIPESEVRLRSAEVTRLRPRFSESYIAKHSAELTRLYQKKKELPQNSSDARDIDSEIRALKDTFRRGPDLSRSDRLGGGRFELIEKLGHGGFGRVWKAWDEERHRCVALKVLFPHLLDERSSVERFFRGARWMSELRHPNIVGVFEARLIDEDDGWHFFVMDLVEGPNLDRAVLEDRLSHSDRHRVIRQVGEALDLGHSHARVIVHRDVKPSNVLLDDKLNAKLTDFDLVRADDTYPPNTAAHTMMGTVAFAAPELLHAPRDAGPAADVYGLASTAVFVLSGQRLPPLYYRDPHATIDDLSIPSALADVLTKATADKAEDRYPTAGAFVEAYNRALKVGPATDVIKSTPQFEPRLPSPILHPAAPAFSDRLTDLARRALAAGDGERSRLVQELILRLMVEEQSSEDGFLPVALHLNRGYLQTFRRRPAIPDALLSSLIVGWGLRQATGLCKRYLEQSLPMLATAVLNQGDSEWRRDLHLLAAAATLCPAILAPKTEAPAILHALDLSEWPQIAALRTAVVEYSSHFPVFDPNVVRWNHLLGKLTGEVKEWLLQARELDSPYPLTMNVWQHWLSSGGEIEVILRPIVEDRPAQADNVVKQCKPWRGAAAVQRKIGEACGQLYGDQKATRIHDRALRWLQGRVTEMVDFVARWLDLLQRRPGRDDRALDGARKLCADVKEVRTGVYAEINADENARAFLSGKTAATCLRRTLDAFYQIFDPALDFDLHELAPRRLLNIAVLAVPSLRPRDDWEPLQEGTELTVRLLEHIARDERPTWKEVFQARIEDHDLAGSRLLLDYLPALDPKTQEATYDYLHHLHVERLDQERRDLKRSARRTQKRVEDALSKGLFAEEDRLRLIGEVSRIEEELTRSDRFFIARGQLRRVDVEIDRFRDQALEEPEAQLSALVTTLENRQRIQAILDREDVWTANEYILRLMEGKDLPGPMPAERSLVDFWPERARTIEHRLQKGSLENLLKAAREGRDVAGLYFSEMDRSERKHARSMLNGWLAARHPENLDGAQAERLLATLGFNDPRVTPLADRPSNPRQTWLDVQVTPIAERSLIPVHFFGSEARGHYRLLCVRDQPDPDTLISRVGDTFMGAPLLVFYFGSLKEEQRRRLARLCRERRHTFAVLDDILVGYLAAETRGRLLTFFTCALPFTWLEPFVTTAGLVPPEMFFGRQAEIRMIQDQNGPCIIYGGRQLGKTALLRHVERSFHRPEHGRVAKWIDLKAERLGIDRPINRIWPLLAHRLAEDTGISHSISVFDSLRGGLKKWLSETPARRILLLLDEADIFLERDGESHFVISSSLKNLMEESERRFKVVFAGLHNVQRTVKSANHPLGHYGEPICIGPLIDRGEWREARELIELPMRMLGCTPKPQDLVTRMLSQTNYYPNLLQLYGQQLLRHVAGPRSSFFDDRTSPPIEVTEQAVDDVYTDQDLRLAIRRRVSLTLQLDGRYHVLAYALASDYLSQPPTTRRKGRLVSWFLREALVRWPDGFTGDRGESESVRAILDEMIGLGVFRRLPDGSYTFRNPNVVTLLGTLQEVEEKLQTEPMAPIEFSPSRFRQPDPDHGSSGYRRSPLTIEQESRLHERRNGVSVMAGCELAALDDLGVFLRSSFHSPFFVDLANCRDIEGFKHRLSTLYKTQEPGTRLIFVPEHVGWSEEWLSVALGYSQARRALDRHVRFAFTADPIRAWRLLSPSAAAFDLHHIEYVSLRPWAEDALRRWIEDLALAYDTKETERLARATGCWPKALYQHYRDQNSSGPIKGEELRTTAARAASLALDSIIFSKTDDELTEARATLAELADWKEPLAEDDIVEGLDTGDPESRERILTWAKRLNLVHHVKDGTWAVDRVFARALKMKGQT